CPYQAPIAANVWPPITATGADRFVFVLSPSSPEGFAPQQYAVAIFVSAHVCSPPALTLTYDCCAEAEIATKVASKAKTIRRMGPRRLGFDAYWFRIDPSRPPVSLSACAGCSRPSTASTRRDALPAAHDPSASA